MTEALSDDERLAELLDRWYAAEESGEAPPPFLQGLPPELVQRFLAIVSRAAEVTASGSDDRPTGAATGLPAERIGRFRLVEARGGGGFANVFLAEDEALARPVALKVLRDVAARDPAARRRFRLEGEILAALEHPGIVPVLEAGEDGPFLFLALRWIEGGTLADRIGRTSPIEAARIGAAVARALHAAHERGIVHRDVKPANVLMEGDTPRLADFGLASLALGAKLTASDATPGTPAYLAPETLEGRPAGPSVDIWGLGVALFETVRGRTPFSDVGPTAAIAARILNDEPGPLNLSWQDRDFGAIVARCLDKDPGRRFPTAEELALELDRFAEGLPIKTRRSGVFSTIWRRARRRPKTFGAFVVVLLALAGTGAVFFTSWLKDEALLAADLGRFDRLLRDEKAATARRLFASFSARHADDPRTLLAADRLRGADAVEELLDALHDLSSLRDPRRLRAALTAVAALPPGAAPEPTATFARAAASAQLGDEPNLALALAGLPSQAAASGAVRAVQRLAEARRIGGRNAAVIPSARDVDDETRGRNAERTTTRRSEDAPSTRPAVDDVAGIDELSVEIVLAEALADRLRGVPAMVLIQRLSAAEPALMARPRYRRALARLYEDAGDFGRALALLEGLAEDGGYSRLVACAAARVVLQTGDFARAEAWLALAPAEPPSLLRDSLEFDVQRQSGDPRAAATLARVRRRWPDDVALAFHDGELMRDAGRSEDALKYFQTTEKNAEPGFAAEAFRLGALQAESDLLAIAGPADTVVVDAARAGRLVAALRDFGTSAAAADLRARAWLTLHGVEEARENEDEAYAATAKAFEAGPGLPFVIEGRAVAVANRIADRALDDKTVEPSLKSDAAAALAALDGLLLRAPKATNRAMLAARVFLVATRGSTEDLETAFDRYKTSAGKGYDADVVKAYEKARALWFD